MVNYFTKREVANITGRIMPQIRFYIDTGYFSSAVKIDNGTWLIPEEDLNKLKADIQYMESSYTVKEVSQKIFYGTQAILKNIDNLFKGQYRRIFEKYYILKVSVDRLLENNLEFQLLSTGNYILAGKVEHELRNLTTFIYTSYINHRISNGDIKNYIKHPITKEYFIHKDEAQQLKEKLEYIRDSYSFKELADKVSRSYKSLLNFNEKLFSVFEYRIIDRKYYFSKASVDKYLTENGLDTLFLKENKLKEPKLVKGITKEKPSPPPLPDHILFDGVNYLSTKRAAELLGIQESSLINDIKKNRYNNVTTLHNKYWISEIEILALNDYLDKSIDFQNIDNEILSNSQKRNILNKGNITEYFPSATDFQLFGPKRWRVLEEDIDTFKAVHLPNLLKAQEIYQEKNPIRLYEICVSEIDNSKYSKTLAAYKDFAMYKINSTRVKKIRNFVHILASTIKLVHKHLKKNIFHYNNIEIETLFLLPELTSSHRLYLSGFLKYCKSKFKDKCAYTDSYNRYYYKPDNLVKDDVYSEEKWINFFIYLIDIDRHIEKAFNDTIYAKTWLFTILHFSVAWRLEDITSIPALKLDIFDKYNLDWFRENVFTLGEGQLIINGVKLILDGMMAHKNDVRNHFVVYSLLVIPTSIAFIAAEYYRRNNQAENIFGKTIFCKQRLDNFFQDDRLKGFQNRKANRSLITHNFYQAVTTEGMADLAYSLSVYLRSHKFDRKSEIASTTAQYIYSTNSDGSSENMAQTLFRRGYFGELYYMINKIANDNKETTIEEVTKSIENLRSQYSPMVLEGISSFALHQHEERIEVLKELLNTPKQAIKEKFRQISRGESPSKVDYSQCFKDDCPYKQKTNCLGCKFLIPMTYILTLVKTQLESLLGLLDATELEDTTSRYRYTYQIMKLLYLLKEAKQEYDQYDKDFIKSFIDLKKLQERLTILQNTKLLIT